jgi:hypothetical protein
MAASTSSREVSSSTMSLSSPNLARPFLRSTQGNERHQTPRPRAYWGSDESEICSVYAAGPEDVDIAVAAARKAFKNPDWRDMDTNARADLMYKFAQLIEEHRETLATIETWDNGTMQDTRTRSTDKSSTLHPRSWHTLFASHSEFAARSSHGTSLWLWQRGNSGLRYVQATQSS